MVLGSRPAPGGSFLARPPAWLRLVLLRAAPVAAAHHARVRLGAVGPPRVALRQLGRQLTPPELPSYTLLNPDHSAPALRRPAAYAVQLPRARLAAKCSSSGPQGTLRSLALTRATVRAVTPWRPRHSVYGAATAAAYVLLARAVALRRSAWGAGVRLKYKSSRTPPPLHCAHIVKGAPRRFATPLSLRP